MSSSLPRQPITWWHEQVISPLHSHLTRLIAAWTGCDANDTRMILHTHALIGEILAFRLGKETILLRTGWTAFDEEKTELINQTVTCHIDLICKDYRKGVCSDEKPVVIGLAVVVLAAVVAGGYWWYQSRQDNGLTLYGNVDIRTVNLSFRVGGRVESLAVDEGDAIKAGQVLGELDHKPYEIA